MHVQQITFDDFFVHPDADALMAEYARESAMEGMPQPQPDRATYKALGASGAMVIYAAFEGEVLAGFIIALVYPNPHYCAVLGVIESFFVGAAHRKTGAGNALRSAAEAYAQARGAIGLLVSAPSGGRLARVMEHTPFYRETNRVFFKALT